MRIFKSLSSMMAMAACSWTFSVGAEPARKAASASGGVKPRVVLTAQHGRARSDLGYHYNLARAVAAARDYQQILALSPTGHDALSKIQGLSQALQPRDLQARAAEGGVTATGKLDQVLVSAQDKLVWAFHEAKRAGAISEADITAAGSRPPPSPSTALARRITEANTLEEVTRLAPGQRISPATKLRQLKAVIPAPSGATGMAALLGGNVGDQAHGKLTWAKAELKDQTARATEAREAARREVEAKKAEKTATATAAREAAVSRALDHLNLAVHYGNQRRVDRYLSFHHNGYTVTSMDQVISLLKAGEPVMIQPVSAESRQVYSAKNALFKGTCLVNEYSYVNAGSPRMVGSIEALNNVMEGGLTYWMQNAMIINSDRWR